MQPTITIGLDCPSSGFLRLLDGAGSRGFRPDGLNMRKRETILYRQDRDLDRTRYATIALVAPDRTPGILRRDEEGTAELILGPTEALSDGG